MRKSTLSNSRQLLTPPFVLFAMLKTYHTSLVHLGDRIPTENLAPQSDQYRLLTSLQPWRAAYYLIDQTSRSYIPLLFLRASLFALRFQCSLSDLGTVAHISLSLRAVVEKSMSGNCFSSSCRTSFDHIMYAVNLKIRWNYYKITFRCNSRLTFNNH